MSRKFLRVVGLLLAVAALTTIVFGAYQAGLAQGDGNPGVVRHYGAWGPYAAGGFGAGFILVKLLFAFLFFALIFGLLRAAFGGPRWSGPWGRGEWNAEHGPRTTFEEWHRRAHEGGTPQPQSDAADPPGGATAQ